MNPGLSRLRAYPFERLQKLLAERKLTIDLDDKAKDWLGQKGYDPAYGARPLKRVIQKYVQDPLAELILQSKVHEGDRVKITADKNGLVINGQAVKQAA